MEHIITLLQAFSNTLAELPQAAVSATAAALTDTITVGDAAGMVRESAGAVCGDVAGALTRSEMVEFMVLAGIFVLPFVFAVVALVLVLRFLSGRHRMRQQTIQAAIARGVELPARFYGRDPKAVTLRSGLMWIAWGAGLGVFFASLGRWPLAALMAVPVLVGVARLILYRIDNSCRGSEQD